MTKPTKERPNNATAQEAEKQRWHITAKRAVGKTIAHYGLNSAAFVPSLEEILEKLKANPYQYPTKEGALSDLRGVDLHFNRQKYRLLYQIFRAERCVRLVVLDERKSDRVYTKGKRLKDGPMETDLDIR